MQYLIAGARANVGLKGGRHMFEARLGSLEAGRFLVLKLKRLFGAVEQGLLLLC